MLPSAATPSSTATAETTAGSKGSGTNTATLAIIVAGVVGTVLAGAIFVYVKTSKRQQDIKRDLESERMAPPPTTVRASLNGQYQQLSPSRGGNGGGSGYDAYAAAGGAGAAVGAGIARGPPVRQASEESIGILADSICDPIDLNDPNFDVLTPLSDIAMAGGGYTESFKGGASGRKIASQASQSSSTGGSESGSVFYDPNTSTLSELYPTELMSSSQNDVSGSDDSDSDEDEDIGLSSFDSQSTFDMPSVSEWNAPDTRSRGQSDAVSVVFSVGSESGDHTDYEDGDEYQSYDVSSGLHDRSASSSSYREYSTHYSEFARTTAASEFTEVSVGGDNSGGDELNQSRFNSTVFSDTDVEDTRPKVIRVDDSDSDSDSDDEGYDGNSFSSDIALSVGNSSFIEHNNQNDGDGDNNGGGSSFSFSSSNDSDDDDGDIVDSAYGYDDDDDDGDFGAESFSSTSSYEV